MAEYNLELAQQAFDELDYDNAHLQAAGVILQLLEAHFNNGPSIPDEGKPLVPPSNAARAWLDNAENAGVDKTLRNDLERVLAYNLRGANLVRGGRIPPDLTASIEEAERAISAAKALSDWLEQHPET